MNEQFPKENNREKEFREEVFLNIVFSDLLEGMIDKLCNAGYLETEDDISHFSEIINNLSLEDKKRVFSLPFELSEKRFKIFLSRGVLLETMIERLIKEAKEGGYTLGYHLSPFDIKAKNDLKWEIKGMEFDDRDEKPMAYYSLDFDNLYRKRHQKYLYIVCAQMGENSAHKYDTSNNWGRSTELSVIDSFDFEEISEKMKKQIKESENKAKKAA